MNSPSNILFVTADQWRGDCLSTLQHPCVRTPHLDDLAASGVLFAEHYCQAVPCGPSRASLHTGLYMMNHRSVTNGTPLDRRHSNWALKLRAAGYDPVLFGYSDTSADPREYPADAPELRTMEGELPGLRTEVHLNEGDVVAWADWLQAQGVSVPERGYDLYLNKADQPEWEQGGRAPAPLALSAEQHDTRYLTDRAIDYISAQSSPWCVHLSLLRPHPPWIAPEPYNALYPPDELPGFRRAETADAEAEQHPWLAWQLQQRYARAPDLEPRLRRLKASYYGLMSEVDDNIGRLVAALKAGGDWENTLIIFTSDHGEQLGDHWLLGKCGYFDQSYHIPMIVRDPRASADATRGTVRSEFTEHVDVMPTLMDWLGLPSEPTCDGRSLTPLLESAAEPERWREAAHWEFDFRDPTNPDAESALGLPQHACNLTVLRDRRYKYVHFAGLPPLLFDLREDPDELVNRAEHPSLLPVRLEYAERLLSWRARHLDQTLTHMKLTEEGAVARPAPRW
jgi:arylsulfatase A-like enzyme